MYTFTVIATANCKTANNNLMGTWITKEIEEYKAMDRKIEM